jgi:hypothetical protein
MAVPSKPTRPPVPPTAGPHLEHTRKVGETLDLLHDVAVGHDGRIVDLEEDSGAYVTKDELDATRESVDRLTRVNAPGIVSLIGGQPDETLTVTGCTIAADTTRKLSGAQSWKLTMAGAATATARLPEVTSGPFTAAISGVGVSIWLEDPAKITAITMQVYTGAGISDYYTFNGGQLRGGLAPHIKAGWNILRWPPSMGAPFNSPEPWGKVHGVRVVVVTNAATEVNLQQVFAEVRPKASLLFIHDGAYSAFDTSPGYFDLRDRGIPVTWAVTVGAAGRMTDARIREVAEENNNSVSFHGWDGTSTGSMDAATAQAHTMRAIKWLSVRGFTGRIWRAAWLQNNSPNSPATEPYVLANAMFGATTERVHAWPFHDRFNVARWQLHGKTEAELDALFTELQTNRGVVVAYTHRVSEGVPTDITPAMWSYLLSKIDAGVAAGWLEGVTLELLLARSGVQIKRGLSGSQVVEWPSVVGDPVRVVLP